MEPDTVDGLKASFDDPASVATWLKRWLVRLLRDAQCPINRAAAMNQVNPIYSLRNYTVQAALAAAEADDLTVFERLLDVLSDPFTKREGLGCLEGPAPDYFGPYKTFCGT